MGAKEITIKTTKGNIFIGIDITSRHYVISSEQGPHTSFKSKPKTFQTLNRNGKKAKTE